MTKKHRRIKLAGRLGIVAVAAGTAALGPVEVAHASTDNMGHAVYTCAQMMLPYDIESRGAITMTMPDGSTMHWRNFGEMVTYMTTEHMCP